MGLFALAQAGDPDALSALLRRHAPLVQALCRRFSYHEDAFQQGCLGLLQAIRRYREDTGYQFSTYAVPVILGEMRRAFSHSLGWRTRAALKKARDYENQVLARTGRPPSIQETAQRAGLPPEELALLLEQDKGPVYDATGLLLPGIADPLSDHWLMRLFIRDILERMPQKESWLIRQRFLCMRSQTELSLALHTSQSSISRMEKQARLRFIHAWNE